MKIILGILVVGIFLTISNSDFVISVLADVVYTLYLADYDVADYGITYCP